MKIGLIADTHGYWHSTIENHFKNIDLILHAGDIGDEQIIHNLEQIAPVKAVSGNTDYYPLTTLFPRRQIFTIQENYFLLIHHFDERRSTDRQILEKNKMLRFIICGHTHQKAERQFQKITIINPGSAAKLGRRETPSLGILELHSKNSFMFRSLNI